MADTTTNLLKNIQIAKITAINEHPDADKLVITYLDLATSENIQVVTGANNISTGDYVPYLAPGSIVPGYKIFENKSILLQAKPLRGVESYGMILSEFEVGFGNDHSGIFILNKLGVDDEDIGKPLIEVFPEVTDKVKSNVQV
jgi:phenylalanyl-tRNA synthetase beta chain